MRWMLLETTVMIIIIIIIIIMTRTTSDTIETREWYIKGIGGDGRCGCVCSSDCGTLLWLWMSGHTIASTRTNTSGGRTSIDRPRNHHGIHHQTTWSTTTTTSTTSTTSTTKSTIVVMTAAGVDDGSS